MKHFLVALVGLTLLAGAARAENPKVLIKTSEGDITLELFQDKAPITVKNFLDYVAAQHYDGTVFHRVIKDFMIQGGGYLPGMKEKTTRAPIKNESTNGLANERGTVAMARTQIPDSATAQFFINTVDNAFLNKSDRSDGYAVFGKVVNGMDVVDKIRAVETPNRDLTPGDLRRANGDVPVKDVVIQSIRVVK